jgi:hypothetical protein
MKDHITLLVTSSAIPTHPDPKILLQVLRSFREYCPEVLQCDIIVSFDGHRIVDCEDEQALKKGKLVSSLSSNYSEYVKRVIWLLTHRWGSESLLDEDLNWDLCDESDEFLQHACMEIGVGKTALAHLNIYERVRSPKGPRVVCLQVLGERVGQALAVREMIRLVNTPFAFVCQHDWGFCNDISIP